MRLLHTQPLAKVIENDLVQKITDYNIGHAHTYVAKTASDAELTYSLTGELYGSKSGWLLLSVPNSLVRGSFDALDEHGLELPTNDAGFLNAHISVMSPDELEQVGGLDKITERGKHYAYNLGAVKAVVPNDWNDVSKVWYITVVSPELRALRKSYGLSPQRNGYDFHITIAIRKKHVLKENDISKAAYLVKKAKLPLALYSILGSRFGFQANLEPTDPESLLAEEMEEDSSHMDTLHTLPTSVDDILPDEEYPDNKVQRNVVSKPIKDIEDELNKIGGVNDGLLAENDEEEDRNDESAGAGYDSGGGGTSSEIGVQRVRQEEEYDCGPAALKAIFNYYGIAEGDLEELRGELNTTADGGTTPDAIVREAQVHNLSTDMQSPMSVKSLKIHIDQGHPVIVAFQSDDNPDTVESGHYAVVVKYDDEKLYLADPAVPDETISYEIEDFVNRWHDEDKDGKIYEQLGIAVWENQEEKQSGVFGSMERGIEKGYDYAENKVEDAWKYGREKIHDVYERLKQRYGPTMAKTIIVTYAIGAPIPGPATGFITSGPFFAAGELMHAFRGDYNPPKAVKPKKNQIYKPTRGKLAATQPLEYMDPDKRKRLKRKEDIYNKLTTMGLPIAGAGIGTAALASSTNTRYPVQTTRFPGEDDPSVIRGLMYPGYPSSTRERQGDEYIALAPDTTFHRTHGTVSNADDLMSTINRVLRKDKKLGLLELAGHGDPLGQDIGTAGRDASGLPGPEGRINANTVSKLAPFFRDLPKTDSCTLFGTGCHTGTFEANKDTKDPRLQEYLKKPDANWQQSLADKAGIRSIGSRGVAWYSPDQQNIGVRSDVSEHGAAYQYKPETDYNIGAEDRNWTLYQPNKPKSVITDPIPNIDAREGKITYGKNINHPIADFMYNLGRPSSVIGSVAAPLLSNKRTARNVALGASAMTLPMLLSEMNARLAETAGQKHMEGAVPSVTDYIAGQSKTLPYLGLTAMPILSYMAAKSLGRWDKPKKGKTNENVRA